MKVLRKIKPELPLRLGLAMVFFYSGWDLYHNPGNWRWAIDPVLPKLPVFLQNIITDDIGVLSFLQIQGGVEIALAVLLLLWFLPRWVFRLISFLISAELLLIIWFVGINSFTFRDVGLLGASLALLSIAYHKR